MSKLPGILKNSLTYTFFNVLQKAISFFLLPLYTIYLTPSDYGIINVLTSAAALLTFFYTFSIQAASARFHYKYSKNTTLVKKIWGSNLLFIIINSIIWCVLSVLFYKYTIIYLIGEEIDFYPYVIICLINCAIAPIFQYYQVYLQTTQKSKHFALNSFINFVITVFLNITFVVFFKMEALGILYAMLITTILFALYSLWYLKKEVIIIWSGKILKKSLSYSIPLLPHTLSGWLNGMLDRIFINRLINLSSVGLYSISYQFGFLINIIAFGVNQAYSPWFFKNHNTIEGKEKIRIISDLCFIIICCIGFFIAIFSKEVLFFMTDVKYHSAWPVIIILVYANLFDTLYYLYVATLFLDKTKILSIISISISLVNCIINYYFISCFGYIGAAYSYLLTQAVLSYIVYILARKIRPDIKFNGRIHYLELLSSITLITPIIFTIDNDSVVINIALKLLVYMISCLWLIYLNFSTFKKVLNEYIPKKSN